VVIWDKHHAVWRKGFIITEDGGSMFQNIVTCPPNYMASLSKDILFTAQF
jgi:hypothetical protein